MHEFCYSIVMYVLAGFSNIVVFFIVNGIVSENLIKCCR